MKIGLIGAGNMGEAIVSNCLKKFLLKINEERSSRRKYMQKKYGVQAVDLGYLTKWADMIILAVKPQDLGSVLNELKNSISKKPLVVSIAAGVSTRYIERVLGNEIRVMRAMPNMPAFVGAGITAVCRGEFTKTSDIALTRRVFDHIGETVVVKESQMDSITAVSGSGPAYVYLFMEELVSSAKKIGLEAGLASLLVEKTLKGSIALLAQEKTHPAALRAKVTSKGGTTQAALRVFKTKKFGRTIEQALKAAKRRAKELSKS